MFSNFITGPQLSCPLSIDPFAKSDLQSFEVALGSELSTCLIMSVVNKLETDSI